MIVIKIESEFKCGYRTIQKTIGPQNYSSENFRSIHIIKAKTCTSSNLLKKIGMWIVQTNFIKNFNDWIT